MPVRLELGPGDREDIVVVDQGREVRARNSKDLLAIVSRTMSSLGDTIVDREIIIKITKPGLPRLTLVDLPGIREVSETMRAASKRLTQNYVRDPNTVVLCVVSATKTLQVRLHCVRFSSICQIASLKLFIFSPDGPGPRSSH